jgi:hypothetical protein
VNDAISQSFCVFHITSAVGTHSQKQSLAPFSIRARWNIPRIIRRRRIGQESRQQKHRAQSVDSLGFADSVEQQFLASIEIGEPILLKDENEKGI